MSALDEAGRIVRRAQQRTRPRRLLSIKPGANGVWDVVLSCRHPLAMTTADVTAYIAVGAPPIPCDVCPMSTRERWAAGLIPRRMTLLQALAFERAWKEDK